jgi:hypothetical protein
MGYRMNIKWWTISSKPGILFNPVHHGVLATFCLTVVGLHGPPKKKDNIIREKKVLMTLLKTAKFDAVGRKHEQRQETGETNEAKG